MSNEKQDAENTSTHFDYADVNMLVECLDDVHPDWSVEPGWRELRGRIMAGIHTAKKQHDATGTG